MSPIPTLESIRVAPARLFAAATFRVLGLPLRVESNSPRVMAAAEAAFGAPVDGTAAARLPGEPAPRVRIRTKGRGGAGVVSHGVPHHELLLVSGRGCRGYADRVRGDAVAEVREGLLDDAEQFRVGVMEALALFLLARLDRDPLHAAAVARGRTALLLAGRSGVGKSTLVYAAARAGMRVLSEDAVFIQLDPLRVWGMPRYVHLTPETSRFFPELEAVRPRVLFNGKTKRAVDLRSLGAAGDGEAVAERAGVCLLARGPRPGIEPVGAATAMEALTAAPEPGFDHFAGSVGERVARVAEGGAWRVTLPPHPADGVPMLRELLDALDA